MVVAMVEVQRSTRASTRFARSLYISFPRTTTTACPRIGSLLLSVCWSQPRILGPENVLGLILNALPEDVGRTLDARISGAKPPAMGRAEPTRGGPLSTGYGAVVEERPYGAAVGAAPMAGGWSETGYGVVVSPLFP